MLALVQQCISRVLSGRKIDRETALQLAACPDQTALWSAADDIRQRFMGKRFHLCSIINARSGNCTENCRFCAQSARYHTAIKTYECITPDKALTIAEDNDTHGVDRLSLVTSGHSVDRETLDLLSDIYEKINRQTSLSLCASMGFLEETIAGRLVDLGVTRYHCNLETSKKFFSTICTSHTWDEKTATLRIAQNKGMSICSGGIIGMGETMADRIDLALELNQLGVLSIPINILTPISGTPLEGLTILPLQEVLTTIALFRLINPRAVIRMAGGRQQLGEEQYRCFSAGANGAIVGNYLTTVGNSVDHDLRQLRRMGFTFTRAETGD